MVQYRTCVAMINPIFVQTIHTHEHIMHVYIQNPPAYTMHDVILYTYTHTKHLLIVWYYTKAKCQHGYSVINLSLHLAYRIINIPCAKYSSSIISPTGNNRNAN